MNFWKDPIVPDSLDSQQEVSYQEQVEQRISIYSIPEQAKSETLDRFRVIVFFSDFHRSQNHGEICIDESTGYNKQIQMIQNELTLTF